MFTENEIDIQSFLWQLYDKAVRFLSNWILNSINYPLIIRSFFYGSYIASRKEVYLFDIRSFCFKHLIFFFNFLIFYFYTFTDLFPKRIKIVTVFVYNLFRFGNISGLMYH